MEFYGCWLNLIVYWLIVWDLVIDDNCSCELEEEMKVCELGEWFYDWFNGVNCMNCMKLSWN